jgi:hypothetical protein
MLKLCRPAIQFNTSSDIAHAKAVERDHVAPFEIARDVHAVASVRFGPTG